jgi:hypothetical protein
MGQLNSQITANELEEAKGLLRDWKPLSGKEPAFVLANVMLAG